MDEYKNKLKLIIFFALKSAYAVHNGYTVEVEFEEPLVTSSMCEESVSTEGSQRTVEYSK